MFLKEKYRLINPHGGVGSLQTPPLFIMGREVVCGRRVRQKEFLKQVLFSIHRYANRELTLLKYRLRTIKKLCVFVSMCVLKIKITPILFDIEMSLARHSKESSRIFRIVFIYFAESGL